MKVLLPILILLAGAGIFVLVVVTKKDPPEKPYELPPRLVKVVPAKVETSRFEITTSGFVEPRDRSSLSAEVSGRIEETHPNLYPGEFFEAGSEIARIDPTDYEVAVTRAESRVANEELNLVQEQARAEQALRDWQLLGRTGKPPPLVAREPQLEQIKSALEAAKADLRLARHNVERTSVKVPFDALVESKEVEVGHYVTPGSPLATLLAVDYAEVRLPIDLEEMKFLDFSSFSDRQLDGYPVDIRIGDAIREAQIIRTENVVDEMTRSIFAVARIADPYLRHLSGKSKAGITPLAVGQFVGASVMGKPVERITKLPNFAMRGREEVALVSNEGKVEIRPVALIYESADFVFVRGLTEGEKVVITSPDRALPGEQVEIEKSGVQVDPLEIPVSVE
ncbi:MAG: efflux RND transporter periplasmic adaptor subunit [Verrucomicrobiota bacterium]